MLWEMRLRPTPMKKPRRASRLSVRGLVVTNSSYCASALSSATARLASVALAVRSRAGS